MTSAIEPVEMTNLDRYGFDPLAWSRPRDLLDGMAPDVSDADRGPGLTTWLATTSPGGVPHLTTVRAIWVDGRFYFTSGAGTRKSRNLAAGPLAPRAAQKSRRPAKDSMTPGRASS